MWVGIREQSIGTRHYDVAFRAYSGLRQLAQWHHVFSRIGVRSQIEGFYVMVGRCCELSWLRVQGLGVESWVQCQSLRFSIVQTLRDLGSRIQGVEFRVYWSIHFRSRIMSLVRSHVVDHSKSFVIIQSVRIHFYGIETHTTRTPLKDSMQPGSEALNNTYPSS